MEYHLIELHSMKLLLINCCFSIYYFYVPIKINKNSANTYTYDEKYKQTILCILYKNYIFFHNHLGLTFKSFYLDVILFHQYCYYILQLI